MEGEQKKVEVIYGGRVVRVPESFAIEEGLPIIKKARIFQLKETVESIGHQKAKQQANKEKEEMLTNFHHKLNPNTNNVLSELIPNFHWYVKKERMKRNLTRKQLSLMIHEPESSIRAIEYGTLPSDDFILINKLQNVFAINLRKDGKTFTKAIIQEHAPKPSHKPIEISKESHRHKYSLFSKKEKKENDLTGDDIEINDSDLEEIPEESKED